MADQASTETTPQAGEQNGGQQPEQASAQAAPATNVADADKIITSLRKENAERRVREKELAEKLKVYEDAKLSNDEKLANRIKDLEASGKTAIDRANELELRLAVERAARKTGIVDEDAAYSLMNKDNLSYVDGHLDTASVEAELSALVGARPWLKAKAAPDTPVIPATNPQKQLPGLLTRADIERMRPEEVNARWDEVQRALGENGR